MWTKWSFDEAEANIRLLGIQDSEFYNTRVRGEFPGDRLGKIRHLPTDIDVPVDEPPVIKKLLT